MSNPQTKKLAIKIQSIIDRKYGFEYDFATTDEILSICKESGLKFVPDKWELPFGDTVVTLENPIILNSQIKEIDNE